MRHREHAAQVGDVEVPLPEQTRGTRPVEFLAEFAALAADEMRAAYRERRAFPRQRDIGDGESRRTGKEADLFAEQRIVQRRDDIADRSPACVLVDGFDGADGSAGQEQQRADARGEAVQERHGRGPEIGGPQPSRMSLPPESRRFPDEGVKALFAPAGRVAQDIARHSAASAAVSNTPHVSPVPTKRPTDTPACRDKPHACSNRPTNNAVPPTNSHADGAPAISSSASNNNAIGTYSMKLACTRIARASACASPGPMPVARGLGRTRGRNPRAGQLHRVRA